MSNILDPNPESVLDLFRSDKKIVVPSYQRPFKWGRSEASELLDDVRSRVGDSSSRLFLGTIILDVSNQDSSISVIDGQQRITTISCLLIACRQSMAKRDGQFAAAIQEKIAFKDPVSGAYQDQRLIVSPSISDIYQHISQEGWDGKFPDRIGGKSIKSQSNRIRPLYEYFEAQVSLMSLDELQQFVRTLYEAYFVRIDIENTNQAFEIFERMNARGIPLDIADLLKNHLFANSDTSDIEKRWQAIVENSGDTPLRMLKYYWTAKNGFVRKSELYRGMRDECAKSGASAFVDDLEHFSDYYSMMREGGAAEIQTFLEDNDMREIASNQTYLQRVVDCIEALRFFRITQLVPLVYSALKSYERETTRNPKQLMAFLESLERYHYVNNMICERVGNEVERLYADYSLNFRQGVFIPTAEQLAKELRKKRASREEFISQFTLVNYREYPIALICYTFDRINNRLFDAKGGQHAKLFFPDPKIQRKNFNVEHILAQRVKRVSGDQELNEAIDSIGNLIVIARHTNSELGSLTPAEKFEKIRSKPAFTNNLPYLTELVDAYWDDRGDWGVDLILKRAEALGRLAFDKVWSF